MTSQYVGKNCDGGHPCSPPKECCKQGCCYLLVPPSVYRPQPLPSGNMSHPFFLGHWYFLLAVTATIAGILCACSLWRRHSHSSLFCCRNSGRDERVSEPDSGSCYAPPQYSRCSSFHQAPPPYTEVTSKPDLYPLVISYNGDTVVKNGNGSTGYLMVQYFRNFIGRPAGSLSATSTIDSLSSSFICNAANEANTIVPPPYSCMGSLEEVSTGGTTTNPNITGNSHQFPRSASSTTCSHSGDIQQRPQNSPSVHSQLSGIVIAPKSNAQLLDNNKDVSAQSTHQAATIRSNPCYTTKMEDFRMSSSNASSKHRDTKCYNCDASPLATLHRANKKIASNVLTKDRSVDSESQEDEHNFSDLLNLSVCIPSIPAHIQPGITHSVANSMTSSDISSLANLGTPDSPPRATSPTAEMRELLDKIQQLPQQRSPIPEGSQSKSNKGYFHRSKAKTLYMPLNEGPNKVRNIFTRGSRNWLSKSAPSTPCDIFAPNFTLNKKHPGSHKNSKVKLCDGSPLLKENEESEDEPHRDECL